MKILIKTLIFQFIIFTNQLYSQNLGNYIDTTGLARDGEVWKIISQSLNPDSGNIVMHNSKWLMYFLHWRPLTEENMDLTPEYVRNHLLNFWGAAMNFVLTGVEGETEICGHKALFAEGSFGNGIVHTRFVVWNCPQTRRQFTADCNINLQRKTPKKFLELQYLITQTACCHDGAKSKVAAQLPQKYESKAWDVSFSIPADWRTNAYPDSTWFPNGTTKENGSLWTLLTNSGKHLELHWNKADTKISSDLFNNFLRKISGSSSSLVDSSFVTDVKLNSLIYRNGYLAGDGNYHLKIFYKGHQINSEYKFKALLWQKEQRSYFLLTSLVRITEFWNRKVDLTPSEETLNKFLSQEIIPNIKAFDKNMMNKPGL